MKQLILIDGNSLLFRAYFAMRPMITSDGIHTQGIYAFINMLNKITGDYKPDYIAVAFDVKEKTFRHEVYPEYKAGRLKTPIELLAEVPLLHRVLDAMNIRTFELAGYEADDIIGTVSAAAESEGLRTLIISGDKDELQLVDANTRVLINRKGMSEFDIYDNEAMKERYNLTPSQFIDLKGLMGDSSDNIPGIPGIGEKKGIALLEQYGSVEGVIEHADEIPGKMGDNVRNGLDSAKLSKWLATIKRDVPIEYEWGDLAYTEPDYRALLEVYTELEFSTFIKRLNISGTEDNSWTENQQKTDLTEGIRIAEYSDFIAKVPAKSEVFIDLESDNNHVGPTEVTGISLFSPSEKLFTHTEFTAIDGSVRAEQLAERGFNLSGYNLKDSLFGLMSLTDEAFEPKYDIEIAEYLIDANRSKYPLDKLLLRYCGLNGIDLDNKLIRLVCISMIEEKQSESLENEGLQSLFNDCEMPLVRTLAEMEHIGIHADADLLVSIGKELTDKISELENSIYEAAGHKFNINSPKQLAVVLFDEMMLPYPKQKGKTSGYSTAADVLEKLRGEYSVVSDVLEYRKLSKLNSTYVEGLLPLIGPDARIHPHFQQTVAATGRLSCTEPNLQNIPIRDDYGRLIRKAFTTGREDFIFTGSDYSQIELRILAALSNDESMIEAFRSGKDIHRATASKVFNIPFEDVSPLDRTKAKAVNFGVVYGMSGFGLSENLSISRAEAQKYISEYFEKHPAVKQYLDNQIETGKNDQAVRTLYGRIRRIPEFASRKFNERELANRLAMNTPIQGTAADIIKYAMNSVRDELLKRGLRSRLVLQIHDELIVEGPVSEEAEVREVLETCMRTAADLAVELTCDIHSARCWYDLK